MLYIEDFLELIEPFPQELRERLTEMREIDLKIQNETDKLDNRIDTFFQQCKRQKSDWKNENYEEIKKEYLKLLDNADDKIIIANQLYDLIEKYIKKLDQELQKFKLELEADHAGITSKLEQVISSKNLTDLSRSHSESTHNLQSFTSSLSTNGLNNLNFNNSSQQFNEQDSDFTLCGSSSTNDLVAMILQQNQGQAAAHHQTYNHHHHSTSGQLGHKRKHSNMSEKSSTFLSGQAAATLASSASINDDDSCSSWNSASHGLNFNLNMLGGGNRRGLSLQTGANNKRQNLNLNLINQKRTAAAGSGSARSKRIKLDRRSMMKKTTISEYDYDDETPGTNNNNNNNNPFQDEDLYQSDTNETGDELLNEAASEVTSSENDQAFSNQQPNGDDDGESIVGGATVRSARGTLSSDDDETSDDFDPNHKIKFSSNKKGANRQLKDDWNSGEDTNERYCICKDVSYGDMVMCDNSRCKTQWFHFVCVGLTSAPKGKWFCATCAEIKKKRKEKQLNAILNANNHLLLSSQSTGSFLNTNDTTLTQSQLSTTSTTTSPSTGNQHPLLPQLTSQNSIGNSFI